MVYAKKILERVSVKNLTDYILYGEPSVEETKDYDQRVDSAHAEFKSHIKELTQENRDNIVDYANELVQEVSDVYAEIGIQAGMLLMIDVMKNTQENFGFNKEDTETACYKDMYLLLTSAISDVLDILDKKGNSQCDAMKTLLKAAQIEAEEIFVNQD